jgi:type VI secretion system secreted protein Hcp
MAFDAFLKLDGIDGESIDKDHARWIDIESFSWGVSQAASGGLGGGAGAGKVIMQDFHFVVNFSKASPELFRRCATGEHIKSGVLAVRKAGEKPLELYKLRMTDILVSSFQQGGGFEVPTEQISLNFSNIAVDVPGDTPRAE